MATLVFTSGCGFASTTVFGTAIITEPAQTTSVHPLPARDGSLEFLVLDTTRASQVGDPAEPGLSLDAKGVFIVVTMSIRNLGDTPLTFIDRDQTLIDAFGTTFSPDMAADIYANPDVRTTRISPGAGLVVRIAFDVPADTVPAGLVLRQSSSSAGVSVPFR